MNKGRGNAGKRLGQGGGVGEGSVLILNITDGACVNVRDEIGVA